jgi:hypothetical protein
MLTTSATFDFRRTTAATPRITRKPTFIPGAIDPDLTRASRTIAPGNMLLVVASIPVIALISSSVLYNLSQTYNDLIVSAIIHALPVILLLASAGLARIVVLARRKNAAQQAAKADATDSKPSHRNLPNAQTRNVSLSGFQTA